MSDRGGMRPFPIATGVLAVTVLAPAARAQDRFSLSFGVGALLEAPRRFDDGLTAGVALGYEPRPWAAVRFALEHARSPEEFAVTADPQGRVQSVSRQTGWETVYGAVELKLAAFAGRRLSPYAFGGLGGGWERRTQTPPRQAVATRTDWYESEVVLAGVGVELRLSDAWGAWTEYKYEISGSEAASDPTLRGAAKIGLRVRF